MADKPPATPVTTAESVAEKDTYWIYESEWRGHVDYVRGFAIQDHVLGEVKTELPELALQKVGEKLASVWFERYFPIEAETRRTSTVEELLK